ncbi:MAG: hypothetical protein AABY22_32835 [Nanoarchaeota archaeon]
MEDWKEKEIEDTHYHNSIKDCFVIKKRQDSIDGAYCKTHKKLLCKCGWEWQWHYGEFFLSKKLKNQHG